MEKYLSIKEDLFFADAKESFLSSAKELNISPELLAERLKDRGIAVIVKALMGVNQQSPYTGGWKEKNEALKIVFGETNEI
jgi:hypothetical protein